MRFARDGLYWTFFEIPIRVGVQRWTRSGLEILLHNANSFYALKMEEDISARVKSMIKNIIFEV